MHISFYICTTLRVNSNVNHEFRVIMMCQCRFIHHNKCATLAGDVDNGEAICVEGQKVYEKSL